MVDSRATTVVFKKSSDQRGENVALTEMSKALPISYLVGLMRARLQPRAGSLCMMGFETGFLSYP